MTTIREMQGFNFGIRNSATPSVDEVQSRYVPSSVYSGPGPAEESPLPPQPQSRDYENGSLQRPSQDGGYAPFEPRYDARPPQPRTSAMLNLKDPVAMHLLMETAIMDSKDFEILSFEELEHLKRERAYLRAKVEGAKRQLGLEKKMNEAAQLMNKLSPSDAKSQKRSSFLGKKSGGGALTPTNELDTSYEKVEQISQEVKTLEIRLQEVDRRIMHHTAGILQFTHRGLKKNVRKNELPRSPESMASQTRSVSGASDFDERSLYQVPEYAHDFASKGSRRTTREVQPIEDAANRLYTLNTVLHSMIQQSALQEHFEPPPDPTEGGLNGRLGAQIQAHLTYMAQGLEALHSAQASMPRAAPQEAVEQIGDINTKLQGILERTNSVGKSPVVHQGPDEGQDLHSQLAYSATVLDRLNQRVDTLIEQKDILTRQIQQQRELNSKSDAQRDAHIRELTEELEETKKLQTMSEKETQQTQDQLELLMEQLDRAKQNEQLLENQASMQDSKALEAERAARKRSEQQLMQDIEAKQHALTALQADFARVQNDAELQSKTHMQQLNDARAATEQAELQLTQKSEELESVQDEMTKMESQLVQFQTELTMARAELDGAYGSRAQRAADVSMNPEIKKQIDDLNAQNQSLKQELELLSQAHVTKGAGSAELQNKVNALQKELKDTIEDYEVMTKASIEFEKERDRLEATIDEMREKCEGLEIKIGEDQVKWLGLKDKLPPDSTSTMVLKNEFKKMMRDSRAEQLKLLKIEQEERRRLEGIIRGLKKESGQATPVKQPAKLVSPAPTTPPKA